MGATAPHPVITMRWLGRAGRFPWLGDNRGRGVGLGLLGRQVGREVLEPSQPGRDPGKAYRAGGGERPGTG